MTVLDAKDALDELATTSILQIEHDTALTWGGRALASYRLSATETATGRRLQRFLDAEAFRQEALEHAAMVEDKGSLLASVESELGEARKAALKRIEGHP